MDLPIYEPSSMYLIDHAESVFKNYEKPYRLTPFIVTFCEGNLTSIDIQNFIEMGLRIVRFRMTHITRNDKIKLIAMLKNAVKWCCEKYDVSSWPIAISIDVPNACIRTGYLNDDINDAHVNLKENTIVEITSRVEYWNKCDEKRIFIDDLYIIESVKKGTEIAIHYGEIVMICIEVINKQSLKCKIIRGGELTSNAFVCIRGVKHIKPPLTKKDLEIIAFAKDFGLDIITMNSVRRAKTLKKVKSLFSKENVPLIVSTICEQEGLDNIDSIIQESDGIILAREFLANEIVNKHQMTAIQLQISAKCRMMGKPLYLSGNILEQTLLKGQLSVSDISDVTNAVLHGSGFVLRNYNDPTNVLKAMRILDSICRSLEPLSKENDFWRMSMAFKIPVNASEACILACALTAKQSGANVVVIPTVTGRTAVQLAHIAPEAIILTISSNPIVAKRLQLYRGIIPIIYDKKTKKDWHEEMDARIQFAVMYGIKHDLLKYGHTYVALRKSSPASAFSDNISIWKVVTKATKNRLECHYGNSHRQNRETDCDKYIHD